MDDRALAKLAKSRIRNSNLRQRSAKEDQRASSMGRRPLVGLEVAYRRAQRGQTEEKQNKMDVCSFSTECPTRWDTSLLSWSSYLRNIPPMRMHRANRGDRVPKPMEDSEATVVAYLCTVMPPIRVGSMQVQRGGTC